MAIERDPDNFKYRSARKHENARQDVQQAQQTIYNFLLEIVKKWPAADVLNEFKALFLHHSETVSSETVPALYTILFSNDQQEFHNTLKRSCYILINNWEVARSHQAVQGLIQLFSDPEIAKASVSPTLKRLRQWLTTFVDSSDFQDLKLFVASRFAIADDEDYHWSSRYTSYLLVPQYIDAANPLEQREAARAMSRRLKDKFKFDLAMYTAFSQVPSRTGSQRSNPTALGDTTLKLIKAIVARRGRFSYRNLARIFHQQTQQVSYRVYKKGLMEYLIFGIEELAFIQPFQAHLGEKLEKLYRKHESRPVDASLTLRTTNRVIEYLLTEDKHKPTELFSTLISQDNPLTLAVVLLKLILISPNANPYLESRLADLIRYYEQFPRAQCQWIINFLEIYSVTFAIYSSDVEYSLVRVGHSKSNGRPNLDDYRVFSQISHGRRLAGLAPPTAKTPDQKDRMTGHADQVARPYINDPTVDPLEIPLEDLDFDGMESIAFGPGNE